MLGIARVYDDEATLKKTERPSLMERGKPKPKEGARRSRRRPRRRPQKPTSKEPVKGSPQKKRRNLPRRSPRRRLVPDGREEVERLHPPGREGRPREEALPHGAGPESSWPSIDRVSCGRCGYTEFKKK